MLVLQPHRKEARLRRRVGRLVRESPFYREPDASAYLEPDAAADAGGNGAPDSVHVGHPVLFRDASSEGSAVHGRA